MATSTATHDYVIADIGLAGFGRREIQIAETEMPGFHTNDCLSRPHRHGCCFQPCFTSSATANSAAFFNLASRSD